MAVPGSGSPLLFSADAGAPGGFAIERSLRFNSADSAYLSRTYSASSTNRKKQTFSFWIKRAALGSTQRVFDCYDGSSAASTVLIFQSDDTLHFYVGGSSTNDIRTTQVFRDASAWYHIVIAVDTTDATASNRVKLYVNGSQVTTLQTTNYPAQNTDSQFPSSNADNRIGTQWGSSSGSLNAYLADVHFIDGQALDPTSFGEFDTNGVWQPIAYSGSYGTNGFHLDFADNSSAAALGYDAAGSNDWTVNNIDAGSVPSVGGYTIPTAAYLSSANYISFPVTLTATTTYEFFTRITTAATYIYFAANTSDDWNIGVNTSNSLLFGNFNGGYTTFSSTGIIGGAWHFVRLTTTGSSTSLYVDGSLVGTNASGGNAATGSRTLKISSGGSGAFQIAHLRVTSGGTPPTTGIPNPSTMNTAAGSGGTLLLYDALDSLTGTGTITSDGGGVTITVTNAVSKSTVNGADIDSLRDSPTNGDTANDTGLGGQVPGNYCTWNPINTATYTFSNGNLEATGYAGTSQMVSTIGVASGKWYCEFEISGSGGTTDLGIGISKGEQGTYPGQLSTSYGYFGSAVKINGGTVTSYGASYTYGDIIGLALDMDAGTCTMYKNNSSQGQLASGLTGTYFIGVRNSSSAGDKLIANFGQRSWVYAAPSGFKALCTANLPTPTIEDPSTVMDVVTYTGNGTSQTISGLGFSPDLVWIKSRSGAFNHRLVDQVQGNTSTLASNLTTAAVDCSSDFTGFTSTGFSLSQTASFELNNASHTYVAWTWDAGSSNATNTSGTITSTVRANISAGFSVVTYTGNGSNGATFGHGLGVAPSFVIIKDRSSAKHWRVYHKSLGNNYIIYLSSTSEALGPSANSWNNTTPSSTLVTLGVDDGLNASGNNYVAYCFAPVASYSSFGNYVGNGSTDGPFIYTGFRPAVVLVKMSSSTGNWTILDDKREGYNVDNDPLYPNLSSAEGTTDLIDITSNGFKVRTTDATFNTSSGTYVYAAWASSPFAYARAR